MATAIAPDLIWGYFTISAGTRDSAERRARRFMKEQGWQGIVLRIRKMGPRGGSFYRVKFRRKP